MNKQTKILKNRITKKYGKKIWEHNVSRWSRIKELFVEKHLSGHTKKIILEQELPMVSGTKVKNSVYFYGESGNGKSVHAAKMMLRFHKYWFFTREWENDRVKIKQAEPTYAFVSVPKLFRQLKEAIQRKESPYSIINRIEKVNYLVLDDLGAERSTEYTYDILYDLIDTREQLRKTHTTIFTANSKITDYKKIYDNRLIRRIMDIINDEQLEFPHYKTLTK